MESSEPRRVLIVANRTAALDGWLWTYNHRRPHGSLSHKPPITRLTEPNNLARSYS